MKYEITKEQRDAILNYLVTKPYSEVYQGVALLTNLPAIKEISNGKPVEEVKA